VIDCRTKPRSRWPQFNANRLAAYLTEAGIIYEFRGNNLGGLSGNVDFDKTLNELAKRAKNGERLVLLCSEGKPQDCHRGTILTPKLVSLGVTVEHLLYDNPKAEIPNQAKLVL
jgi:uncharacterized protein (DUF488 family)